MAGYSKEADRQNKALKDLMTTGKTEKDYVQVGYEGEKENLGGKELWNKNVLTPVTVEQVRDFYKNLFI